MDKKWYVVKAISGQEKKIKQQIDAEVTRLKLAPKVSQVLIPIEKVFEMRQGKKRTKERNFFPGYILVEAQLDDETQQAIRNCPGVLGFLGTKDAAVPLREPEVNRILGKVNEINERGEVPSMSFVVGEQVRVMDGPFNGFSGVVDEINEEKKKIKVMVKIFGRRTPLELSYMQVEREG